MSLSQFVGTLLQILTQVEWLKKPHEYAGAKGRQPAGFSIHDEPLGKRYQPKAADDALVHPDLGIDVQPITSG